MIAALTSKPIFVISDSVFSQTEYNFRVKQCWCKLQVPCNLSRYFRDTNITQRSVLMSSLFSAPAPSHVKENKKQYIERLDGSKLHWSLP